MEIAHVLLMDIVGYSKLLIDDQQAAIRQLNAIVRANPQVEIAEADRSVIRLPTGDGMALVFFSTPEAPVRCAVEVARRIRAQNPPLPVRMGVHSGPVTALKEDEALNVAGAGINLAQRVMDCGDAGHILLSQRVAEDIGEFREWRPHLHDLGECTVKHEMRVHLFNLCGPDFGNAALPSKLQAAARQITRSRRSRLWWQVAAGLAMVIALALIWWWFWYRQQPRSNVRSDKSIAVLPFENFSDDKANAFFADGLQDDILTALAKIKDLRVISRTSAERYRGPRESRNLREIAKTLGVGNVLEGSVRREGTHVIVNAQLIDALQDRHLWANRYELTLQDSLGVDGQIARAIADALHARLTPEEATRVQSRPTQNPQAYDVYLQAKTYEFNPDTFLQDYRTAEQLYLQAITIDPNFALAHARLAATCARIYHFYEPTEPWKKRARAEAQIALQLQPNLGEAHHALGLCYYWFDYDYGNALIEFGAARTLLPNDSSVPWDIAAIKRRQGRWQEALVDYRAVLSADPQNANVVRDLLYVYCALRDWQNAQATAERLIALSPDSLNAKAQIGYVDFWRRGTTARLKDELAGIPPAKDPDGAFTAFRIDASLIDSRTGVSRIPARCVLLLQRGRYTAKLFCGRSGPTPRRHPHSAG
jgi:TolB-like protein/class 3 adenylate cyclase/Tfp pilus assembly protein PilF